MYDDEVARKKIEAEREAAAKAAKAKAKAEREAAEKAAREAAREAAAKAEREAAIAAKTTITIFLDEYLKDQTYLDSINKDIENIVSNILRTFKSKSAKFALATIHPDKCKTSLEKEEAKQISEIITKLKYKFKHNIGKTLQMSISKRSTITNRLDVIKRVYEDICTRMFTEMHKQIKRSGKK